MEQQERNDPPLINMQPVNSSRSLLLIISLGLNAILIVILALIFVFPNKFNQGPLAENKTPVVVSESPNKEIIVDTPPVETDEINGQVGTSEGGNVITYKTNGVIFDYPAYMKMDPSGNQIIMYDPAGSKEPNSSVILTDQDNPASKVVISKTMYHGEYNDGWGYGDNWEGSNVIVTDLFDRNLSGLEVTELESKTLKNSKIYLLSDSTKSFTIEIVVNDAGNRNLLVDSNLIVSSIKVSN